MTHIREERRLRALEMYDYTGSPARSCASFHMKRATLNKWLRQRELEGHVHERKRSGRSHALPMSSERKVVRMLADRHMSTRRVAARLSASGTPVSQPTIVRIARRRGLRYVKERKKPALTDAQKQQRLQWCRSNINTNWNHVIFSDEASFEQAGPPCSMYIRHHGKVPLAERYKFAAKIMVWGAVCANGRSSLQVMGEQEVINAARYQEILKRFKSENVRQLVGQASWILLHDRAPAHRAQSTKQWLKENKFRAFDDFPANSPDLNIIEEVWNIMKKRLYAHRVFASKKVLEQAVRRMWRSIGQEKIMVLVQSMPHRIQACIDQQGGHTKY